ncbi:hypothetical protein AVEN_70339-1 [Araneus ventricosus]|uniref:Cytochrome P450 4C1 n=1 Tax=Araneus ventricosus TaxID=182803 RepID=A0A4Y2THI5_ARAVE|nr:hypothetical protein AVEN_70339-1 [Araneus ventricosus]
MLTVLFYVLLFGSAGDKWKTQRKMLNPCFRSDILKEHLLIINEQSQILVKLLEGETEKDFTRISKFLSDCTFDIICGRNRNILTSGHLKALRFSRGDKKFNICTKCNMIEATTQHLFDCVALVYDDLLKRTDFVLEVMKANILMDLI